MAVFHQIVAGEDRLVVAGAVEEAEEEVEVDQGKIFERFL